MGIINLNSVIGFGFRLIDADKTLRELMQIKKDEDGEYFSFEESVKIGEYDVHVFLHHDYIEGVVRDLDDLDKIIHPRVYVIMGINTAHYNKEDCDEEEDKDYDLCMEFESGLCCGQCAPVISIDRLNDSIAQNKDYFKVLGNFLKEHVHDFNDVLKMYMTGM